MWLETSSIFIPAWQARKQQTLQQTTLDMIASWNAKRFRHVQISTYTLGTPSQKSWPTLSSPAGGKPKSYESSISTTTSNESLYSMRALERLLEANPEPLRNFSALNDFSGENVAFLTAVAEWKRCLRNAVKDAESMQNAYAQALSIYHEFISPSGAQFPLNLSFQELSELGAIFGKAAEAVYEDEKFESPIVPFVSAGLRRIPGSPRPSSQQQLNHASYWDTVPEAFGETVFDQAEQSIKYLVLTNTWPKFLQSRQSLRASQLQPDHSRGFSRDWFMELFSRKARRERF